MSEIVLELPPGPADPQRDKFFEGLKAYLDQALPGDWKIALVCLQPNEADNSVYNVYSFNNMDLDLRTAVIGRWYARLNGGRTE